MKPVFFLTERALSYKNAARRRAHRVWMVDGWMLPKNCQFLAPKFAFFGQIWRPPLANKRTNKKRKESMVLFGCVCTKGVLFVFGTAGDNMAALIICNMI